MQTLMTIAANPRRRRRSGKGRSAAQKAATRKMQAANRARRGVHRNPTKRRRSRARSVAAPAVRHVRRRARSARRSIARHARSFSMRGISGGATALLKTGAIGAGGALAVDVVQGFVNGFLPASMNSKLDATGGPNYLNAAVKFGVTLAVRVAASKVLSAETANKMAAGAVTVQAYELLRPMVAGMLPASMSLGWYSPGMTFAVGSRPGMGVGKYMPLAGMGKYQNTNVLNLRSPHDRVAAGA